ncbi:hypothetical protein, partial [Devosia sp.]|uniref:hypothetical protein n=1 Tax=Devosia sp. TaxID=1871048 RepID=UPI0025BAA501
AGYACRPSLSYTTQWGTIRAHHFDIFERHELGLWTLIFFRSQRLRSDISWAQYAPSAQEAGNCARCHE